VDDRHSTYLTKWQKYKTLVLELLLLLQLWRNHQPAIVVAGVVG
jgi:hypothetical protein